MDIHELLRPEKARWRKIREAGRFEPIREGYNELDLVSRECDKAHFLWVAELLKSRVGLGARILDAGCGPGNLCREFKTFGYSDLTGLDISDANVEAAKPHFRRVHRGVCESIPEPDGTFDAIVCNEVIEHVIDVRGALRELRRVLKPRGWLFISTDNSLWQTLTLFRNWLVPRSRAYARFVQPLDGDFSPFEFRGLLDECGFGELEYIGVGAFPFASRVVERFLGRPISEAPLLKYFSCRFAFLARPKVI